NTMTERIESAIKLLDAVPGLCSYWQPNPDLDTDTHVREIRELGDRLTNVHVFAWTAGNVRHALEQGAASWTRYVQAVRSTGGEHDFILEFVKDESPEQLVADARTLAGWLGKV
nr:xylose isomerase [Clostridia bacterium]